MTTLILAAASRTASWTPVAIVTVCALLFTVGSFWWINARQGKLQLYEPHSFAACANQQKTLLRLPLVMYNTGAKPIIVQDLRLRFPDEPGALMPLPWRTSRAKLMPASDDGHLLPSVFSVAGREAEQIFIEFGAPFPGFVPEARDYRIRIEARLGHRKDWTSVLTFTWRAAHMWAPTSYIAYSNSPQDLTREDVEKADAALKILATKVKATERGE
ncbi:hypothetical protein GCM10023347_04950 [Streptomyces chumphonensis]|uniref:Uncharacterized protein n=1 Tax=Streptomyces chumphonensis TaxID=1214925 RepID=A0A927F2F0_9ACTN|nr:hypothetical protein [Streptomyces chumphonensis]MBD3933127.1 hypothetical protein [Streptomyces chumphonensis]